ncbi:MAG: hypothetical protein LBE81_00635 [Azonexus sp.]|jgi:hypothetical protein|uniref:hypothetical protein n=1 Tax=Azonexus sp. TaxID=1872668 RepID=UPI00282A312C|nr:hypothetical protein [Azonexus sp.]MDR0775132.1 hypothetical protein [Azonexus sp.]
MQIEAADETPVGRLLDLSLRLNMLSQRMARLYLLAYAGDRSQSVLTDLQQDRLEFIAGLYELETARENSPDSREAISLAKTQWLFFVQAIGTSRGGERQAKNVATSSERIAQMLNEVSAHYADSSAPGQLATDQGKLAARQKK